MSIKTKIMERNKNRNSEKIFVTHGAFTRIYDQAGLTTTLPLQHAVLFEKAKKGQNTDAKHRDPRIF